MRQFNICNCICITREERNVKEAIFEKIIGEKLSEPIERHQPTQSRALTNTKENWGMR